MEKEFNKVNKESHANVKRNLSTLLKGYVWQIPLLGTSALVDFELYPSHTKNNNTGLYGTSCLASQGAMHFLYHVYRGVKLYCQVIPEGPEDRSTWLGESLANRYDAMRAERPSQLAHHTREAMYGLAIAIAGYCMFYSEDNHSTSYFASLGIVLISYMLKDFSALCIVAYQLSQNNWKDLEGVAPSEVTIQQEDQINMPVNLVSLVIQDEIYHPDGSTATVIVNPMQMNDNNATRMKRLGALPDNTNSNGSTTSQLTRPFADAYDPEAQVEVKKL